MIPNTAGTESSANTTSLSSIQTRQRRRGVANFFPFSNVKNLKSTADKSLVSIDLSIISYIMQMIIKRRKKH